MQGAAAFANSMLWVLTLLFVDPEFFNLIGESFVF
jgi:hypothetical protein